MAEHALRVYPLPTWLDTGRLLGAGFELEALAPGLRLARAVLDTERAADVQARLRGVGLGGHALVCEVTPGLPRTAVRKARLEEARRLRDKGVGFAREGTRLDAAARVGLTPEALALAIGRRARRRVEHVVDLCAGAGGNAIGFARAGCSVTAIERDEHRVAMLRHNARVYGVAAQIEVVVDDVPAWLARAEQRNPSRSRRRVLWFIDPPWGGRYDAACVRLEDLPPIEQVLALRPESQPLWAKLPPSFDVSALQSVRPRALFGAGEGDARRVKLLLLEL
jgi:hypothetical protein